MLQPKLSKVGQQMEDFRIKVLFKRQITLNCKVFKDLVSFKNLSNRCMTQITARWMETIYSEILMRTLFILGPALILLYNRLLRNLKVFSKISNFFNSNKFKSKLTQSKIIILFSKVQILNLQLITKINNEVLNMNKIIKSQIINTLILSQMSTIKILVIKSRSIRVTKPQLKTRILEKLIKN